MNTSSNGSAMQPISPLRRSLGRSLLALGVGASSALLGAPAQAGCGWYSPTGAAPAAWHTKAATDGKGSLTTAQFVPGADGFRRVNFDGDSQSSGIVGLWKFTMVSDGSAYPAAIPFGAEVDFGTAQWHSDGTEISFSGGRPPSSGDVCMGVWQKTGARTYKLKHIALAWISGDTPPPIGPVSPAVFVGPAIIRQDVKLAPHGDRFEGSFTIDQYAKDETTLLQHIGGKITGTRVTVD